MDGYLPHPQRGVEELKTALWSERRVFSKFMLKPKPRQVALGGGALDGAYVMGRGLKNRVTALVRTEDTTVLPFHQAKTPLLSQEAGSHQTPRLLAPGPWIPQPQNSEE